MLNRLKFCFVHEYIKRDCRSSAFLHKINVYNKLWVGVGGGGLWDGRYLLRTSRFYQHV